MWRLALKNVKNLVGMGGGKVRAYYADGHVFSDAEGIFRAAAGSRGHCWDG
jgi:hypothetical protein